MTDFERADVASLIRSFADGSLSVVDHLRQCLQRIDRDNARMHAMREVYADAALQRATWLQERRDQAASMPLFGLPIAIKDNMAEAGKPNRAGRPDVCHDIASQDAVVVKRLSDAGAIVVGRANMDELAYGVSGTNPHTGRVLNPNDVTRHPGGSSAGSGAAVAASMVPVALGTDTAGSVRIPASLCGVVGMRPTHGRVDTTGVAPLCPSLDTVGVLGKRVADVALVLSVIAGDLLPAGANATAQIDAVDADRAKALKIGAVKGTFAVPVNAAVDALFEQACRAIVPAVHAVESVTIDALSAGPKASGPIIGAQATYAWDKQLAAHPDWFGEEVSGHLTKGAGIKATRYLRALQDMDTVVRGIDAMFDKFDVLMLPTTPIVATSAQEPGSQLPILALTVPFSLGGYPAISVPMGTVEALPVGVQFVARRNQDTLLLALAAVFERLKQA